MAELLSELMQLPESLLQLVEYYQHGEGAGRLTLPYVSS